MMATSECSLSVKSCGCVGVAMNTALAEHKEQTLSEVVLNIPLVIIVIVGLLGNILFLINSFRNPLPSRITNFLIRLQSTFDIAVCLCTIVIALQPLHWLTGVFLPIDLFICHAWHSQLIYWSCVFLSVQNLVLIAIDRYAAVLHPIRYRQDHYKWRKRVAALYLIVATPIVLSPTPLEARFNHTTYVCTGELFDDSEVIAKFFYGYSIFWFCMAYAFPTIAFIGLYGMIVKTLIQNLKMGEGSGRVASTKKFTLVTMMITIFFILTFSFNSIYYVIGKTTDITYNMNGSLQRVSVCFLTINSSVNPFIYIIFMKSFRRDMKRTICCEKTTGFRQGSLVERNSSFSNKSRAPNTKAKLINAPTTNLDGENFSSV